MTDQETPDPQAFTGRWTGVTDIEKRWRPLSPAELVRAPANIRMVESAINRRWPDVDARIASGKLDVEDVRDVVAMLTRQLLEVDPDIPLSTTRWQEASGTESLSVTLDGPLSGATLVFDKWMVDALDNPDEQAERENDSSPMFYAPPPNEYEERAFDSTRLHPIGWWEDYRA
jgi:hypothetical protein